MTDRRPDGSRYRPQPRMPPSTRARSAGPADANAAVTPATSQAWRRSARRHRHARRITRPSGYANDKMNAPGKKQKSSTARRASSSGRSTPQSWAKATVAAPPITSATATATASRGPGTIDADGGDGHRIRRKERDGSVDARVGVGRGARPNDIWAGQIPVLRDTQVPLAVPGREDGCQPTHVCRDEHQNEDRGRGHDEA